MSVASRRVVVAGMFCGDPHQGGAVWATMQWVLGLRELGHEVLVVDQLAPGRTLTADVRRCFERVVHAFGLEGAAVALVTDDDRSPTDLVDHLGFGDVDVISRRLADADVLLNMSGRLRAHHLVRRIPVRVFVDLDPAFVQIWSAQGCDLGLAAHTHTATVGTAVGTPACTVPTLGRTWLHVLPPVALSHWPAQPLPTGPMPRLTTVANLRSYGCVTWNGAMLGQKVHSLRDLLDLGARSPVALELAMAVHAGDEADGDALSSAGWSLTDPRRSVGTPDRYRRYLQGSWGEIGVAKHGYVAARTGWVSDRSAAYLATGRPVVVQGTGAQMLSDREGVLVFDDVDGAVDAIGRLAADPRRHALAARAVAEELFDARRVLRGLLTEVDA